MKIINPNNITTKVVLDLYYKKSQTKGILFLAKIFKKNGYYNQNYQFVKWINNISKQQLIQLYVDLNQ